MFSISGLQPRQPLLRTPVVNSTFDVVTVHLLRAVLGETMGGSDSTAAAKNIDVVKATSEVKHVIERLS